MSYQEKAAAFSADYLKNDFQSDLKKLFKATPDPERPVRRWVKIAGAICFLFSVGALAGFRFAYRKLNLLDAGAPPSLNGQPRVVYTAMIAGALLVLLVPLALLLLFVLLAGIDPGLAKSAVTIMAYVLVNIVLTSFVMFGFRKWQRGINDYFNELARHGTARLATKSELLPYEKTIQEGGFYIGNGYFYSKSGHILTCAGTRAGKGINLILPNLLPSVGAFAGSWVIIDPKGENAAVTARVMRESGKKVVILNPWDLLNLGGTSYNPLDLLKPDRKNLSDDVQMIAESIVPIKPGSESSHFDERARSLIAGLLLHLVTAYPEQDRHLGTLWEWLRLEKELWGKLLESMTENQDENAGDIVRAAGFENISMMETGAREFSSILSTARKWTDFIKSPALRDTLDFTEGFSSADLSLGNTVLYVIIPADRLKTHYQWLRLVVVSLMRSVIRNPKNDVCFLLDEFYALGYLSEIETALGAYAGFGVHLWPILQNLVQLKDLYGNNWENFISSCSVRHYFNINDNFTADYVSKSLGTLSVPSYDAMGNVSGASARPLVTPDELRRFSGSTIYTIIDSNFPAAFPKAPYFEMPGLVEGKHYDKNPYFRG